jgi:hypothetical protein
VAPQAGLRSRSPQRRAHPGIRPDERRRTDRLRRRRAGCRGLAPRRRQLRADGGTGHGGVPRAHRRARGALSPDATAPAGIPRARPNGRPHRALDQRRGDAAGRGGHGAPAAPWRRDHPHRHVGVDVVDAARTRAHRLPPRPVLPRAVASHARPVAGGLACPARARGRHGRRRRRIGECDSHRAGAVDAGRHGRHLRTTERRKPQAGRALEASRGRAGAFGRHPHRPVDGAGALARRACRRGRGHERGRSGGLCRVSQVRLQAAAELCQVHRATRQGDGGRRAGAGNPRDAGWDPRRA